MVASERLGRGPPCRRRTRRACKQGLTQSDLKVHAAEGVITEETLRCKEKMYGPKRLQSREGRQTQAAVQRGTLQSVLVAESALERPRATVTAQPPSSPKRDVMEPSDDMGEGVWV